MTSLSFVAPCTDGQLRLVGGYVDNEGRVEICLNNEWGTICDDNWNTNDAEVVCSVLGFGYTGEASWAVGPVNQVNNKSCFLLFQMLWNLPMPTSVLELVISFWTMLAALGQSHLSLIVPILQLSIAPLVIVRMLE